MALLARLVRLVLRLRSRDRLVLRGRLVQRELSALMAQLGRLALPVRLARLVLREVRVRLALRALRVFRVMMALPGRPGRPGRPDRPGLRVLLVRRRLSRVQLGRRVLQDRLGRLVLLA